VLQPIKDFEKAGSFGVGKLEQFTWKQLLDSYTCTECGRCTAACPANLTGKVLSPKQIIVDIRHLMEEQVPAVAPWTKRPDKPSDLIETVGFEPIWDCVTCGACVQECPVFIEHVPTIMDMRRYTCGACVQECPVFIEHVPTIMDMRRYMVMEQTRMPETAQATLMQLEQRGHPWRGAQLTRTSWIEEMAAEGIEVPMFDGSLEYLFWVGCSGALQERNVKVTKATARLLLEAGVSFGVLGNEEGCSGDPARRLGNEYLYQMQAQANIDVFKAKGVQKVLTMCPHCFNTMQHEYPQLDGRFEVIHHSVLLEQLIREGKLRPQSTNGLSEKTATYHDPCYIARHNDILEEPLAGDAALQEGDVLLWGRRRPHVGRGERRPAHQPRPHGGGSADRRRHHRRGLPLLHADVRGGGGLGAAGGGEGDASVRPGGAAGHVRRLQAVLVEFEP